VRCADGGPETIFVPPFGTDGSHRHPSRFRGWQTSTDGSHGWFKPGHAGSHQAPPATRDAAPAARDAAPAATRRH